MATWCSDIYPDVFRLSIAGFLGKNWKHLVYNYHSRKNGRPNFVLFWSMIISLLQDIEETVRHQMCNCITSMINQSIEGLIPV